MARWLPWNFTSATWISVGLSGSRRTWIKRLRLGLGHLKRRWTR
ncbi:unnamed protein product [Ixodes pacificus]